MKKQTLPLISVIMPVHNAGRFLVPAIEHIVKQTYPRIELIIAAHEVTNETWQRLKKIKAGTLKRIRLFQLQEGTNALTAINAVILRAHGSYIAIAEETSIWSKTKIAKQLAAFESIPRPVAIASYAKVIQAGAIRYRYAPTDPDVLYRRFALTNPIELSTLMVRRDALPKLNLDPTLLNLLTRGRIVVIPEFLVTVMQRSKQPFVEMKKMFTSNIQDRLDAVKHTGFAIPAWALAFLITQYVILQTVPDSFIAAMESIARSVRKTRYAFPFS